MPKKLVKEKLRKGKALQGGGDHYKAMAIQPALFCEMNNLSGLESSIVKYICRWKIKHKDGGVDLGKIKQCVDLIGEIHGVEIAEAK